MSKARYTIVIQEHCIEDTIISKTWDKISEKEGEEYGYTPETATKKNITRTILEQNVENLDIVNVIKAINGIE